MVDTVACPSCGTLNNPRAERCRICGNLMAHDHVRAPGAPTCIHCGKPLDEGAEICNACTRPVREVVMSNLPEQSSPTECVHWSEKPAAAGRSARVMVAGILIVMAGILGVGQSVIGLVPEQTEPLMSLMEAVVPGAQSIDDYVVEYVVLQVWVLFAGLMALVGGVFAMTQKRFEISVAGGVFGMLAIGFLLGLFLGLVGLLLVVTSRKSFLPEC